MEDKKKIILFSQNDQIFLRKKLPLIVDILSIKYQIKYVFLSNPSPFGKRMSIFNKIRDTIYIFGISFFIYYSFKMLIGMFVNFFYPLKNQINNIVFIKENINKYFEENKLDEVDLAVSLAGNHIIKEDLLKWPRSGWINLHCAPLPLYRGLMPSFWALKNDEEEFGATVFLMDEGIDSGPIICQKKFNIQGLTQQSLIDKSKDIGIELISHAVDIQLNGNVNYISNEKEKSTYYTFPTRTDVAEFRRKGKKFF